MIKFVSALLLLISVMSSALWANFGSEVSPLNQWCSHQSAYKIYGDFDGDGNADWMCADSAGDKWFIYSDGRTWNTHSIWCTHDGALITSRDLNQDGRSDLQCQDRKGQVWNLYANESGMFYF